MQDNQKDLAIIDRLLSGDQSAYRALIDRHKSYAFTIAYRILNHREEAEEVAQDAFIKVFQSLASFNREAKFTTWFYRIVFNAALGRKRKGQLPTSQLDDVELNRLGATLPTDDVTTAERSRYIQLAMSHLLPDDVTLLTLFYLKELSLEEIAEITDIATNTIKVKLHRARKRMAEVLSGLLKQELHTWL